MRCRQKLAGLRARPEGLPEDLSVLYYRMPRLFAALGLAQGDGRHAKLLKQLARAGLLLLDDWSPEPLSAEQARDPPEIVKDRYDAGSVLITSQVPVDRWYEMIAIPPLGRRRARPPDP